MAKRRVRDSFKGSEYGGTDGLVQPPPHEPTAREQLIAIHQRKVLPPAENPDMEGSMLSDVLPASTDQYREE